MLIIFPYPGTHAYGCSSDPSLYFIDKHNIKCIDLGTFNLTYVSVRTVKNGLAGAGAIDIDHREKMIYWSDNVQWTINRLNLSTGDVEVNSSLFSTIRNNFML